MCDTCQGREQRNHRQMVANPQPAYPGPDYAGRPDPVTVDPGLHDLLQVLWAQGFETQFSCEGWPYGSDGAKYHGTRGYILFRKVEDAMKFFTLSHEKAAAQDECCPHLVLETTIGLAEDMSYLDEHLHPRGCIRFEYTDLRTLEALWTR